MHKLLTTGLIVALYVYVELTSSVSTALLDIKQPHDSVQQLCNCTPPRTVADARNPFCFVPDTVSPEARRFLSSAAAGATPFGAVDFAEQAKAAQQLRTFLANITAPLPRAAEQQYLQTDRTRNSTIGGVPVVVAVPKGINHTAPGNTKTLLYLHGEDDGVRNTFKFVVVSQNRIYASTSRLGQALGMMLNPTTANDSSSWCWTVVHFSC